MRREKKKEKKKKGIARKIFLIILLVLVFSIGTYFGYWINKNGGGLQGILATFLGQNIEELEDVDPINVLLLGISEDIDAKLTDTIMVCSYNPKTQRASMLSIPRDTFVGKSKSRASGYDKINSLYSRKGGEEVLSAVEEITGMDINYYVVVNNKVVIDLVNAVGGVYFDVPIDMNYDDKTQNLHIHLNAGYQKLDGDHAEQLLRFRHNNDGSTYPSEYGDNDYGRMKTQREFMMAVFKQTLSIKNLTNIKTIMTTIFQNIETNIKLEDTFPYVPHAVSFDTANISSNQIAGASEKCNELWFFVNDEEKTLEIVTQMNNYVYGIEATEETSEVANEIETENITNSTNTSSKPDNTTKNSIKNTSKETETSNTTKKSNTTKSSTNTTKKTDTTKNSTNTTKKTNTTKNSVNTTKKTNTTKTTNTTKK